MERSLPAQTTNCAYGFKPPRQTGSEEVLELGIGESIDKLANVIFQPIQDRHDHTILLVRDQNTRSVRNTPKKRLMT